MRMITFEHGERALIIEAADRKLEITYKSNEEVLELDVDGWRSFGRIILDEQETEELIAFLANEDQ